MKTIKHRKRLLLSCSIATSVISACFAKTIYVSPTGSDTNNGNSASPFRTLGRAHQAMQSGDTCVVRSGTYRETLTITKSNLKFIPENWHQATISANNPVNGWTWHQNNIYVANNSLELGVADRQLYHNGQLMDLARWPNNSDNSPYTVDAHPANGGSLSRIDASSVPANLTGAYVWYLGGHAGMSWTRQINWQNTNSIGFNTLPSGWPFDPHNPSVWRNGNNGRFFVFNQLALLDSGREWFQDDGAQKLYFRAANGAEPVNGSVEVTRRKNCVIVEGDNVILQGLRFFGGNVVFKGNGGKLLGSLVLHGKQQRAIDLNGASVGDGSVVVEGTNCLIYNNTIERGSVNGIMIPAWGGRGLNTTVQNNTIRYFNTEGLHASPVRGNAAGLKVLTNVIAETGRDAVYAIGNDSEIAYNDVSRGLLINDDGGLFYTVGNTADRDITVHHNWFHDTGCPSYAGSKGAGIYLDNDSKGFVVHHNVIWNVCWSGVQMNWANQRNNIYHNTIWNPGVAMGTWVNGRVQSDNRIWNNYSSKADWINEPGFDKQNNLINATNQFVTVTGRNFMPKWNSPLVNGGRFISGFDQREKGAAPDIGAYEYGGTRWTAGRNAIEDTGFLNLPIGSSITLRAVSNLRYVSSENGSAPMNCNRNSVTNQEVFQVVDAGNGKIGLRGNNQKYVSSNNGGVNSIRCDRPNLASWESFEPILNGNGTISFRGVGQVPGQSGSVAYVSGENGASPMKCNRGSVGWWEQFIVDPR